MQITEAAWVEYINKMSSINKRAAELMEKYMDTHGTEDMREMFNFAAALIEKYGSASGDLACRMYERIAEEAGAMIDAAEMAELPEYAEIAQAVQGSFNQSKKLVPSTVGRMVKQVGADTMLQNAARDGAEFAWVPHGDTCAFCLTLASRGWQRISRKAGRRGHAKHIHSNCDCEYAVRFNGSGGVKGYDPKIYQKMYYDADSDINELRRKINGKKQRKDGTIKE